MYSYVISTIRSSHLPFFSAVSLLASPHCTLSLLVSPLAFLQSSSAFFLLLHHCFICQNFQNAGLKSAYCVPLQYCPLQFVFHKYGRLTGYSLVLNYCGGLSSGELTRIKCTYVHTIHTYIMTCVFDLTQL